MTESQIVYMEPISPSLVTGAQVAPAPERNKRAITDQLLKLFPLPSPSSRVTKLYQALEIASGTGQHVTWFAQAMPHFKWQPSDIEEVSITSISAYTNELLRLKVIDENSILPPIYLDTRHFTENNNNYSSAMNDQYDLILVINMTHISPWESTLSLMSLAQSCLKKTHLSRFVIYGPFKLDGKFTTPSNAEFHQALVDRDPSYGYRDIADVVEVASKNNLQLIERVSMPANNFLLTFGFAKL